MHNKTFKQLFQKNPGRWGLRGDPHLWQAMSENLSEKPLPVSIGELTYILEREFEAITGVSLSHKSIDHVYVKQLDHGGMSRGLVSLPFWQETAFPLLIERYLEHQS